MWKLGKFCNAHPAKTNILRLSRTNVHLRSLRFYASKAQFVPFFQIDSFSPVPYGGNPAAVLLLPLTVQNMDEDAMMKVAEENNLSETCYVKIRSSNVPSENPFVEHSSFDLKWFTPTNEVNLCGHGTLASAAAIFEVGNQNNKLSFHTLSGELIASRVNDSISLDFPLNTPTLVTEEHHDFKTIYDIAKMMLKESNAALDIVKLAHCKVTKKLIVHTRSSSSSFSDLEALQALHIPPPDRVLSFHDGHVVTGVSIVVKGDAPYDFCSRYFSPWNGIPEDPVNGSSHTVLAPYWMKEEAGKETLFARQASPRGGDITLQVDFDGGRVSMAGPASITIVGEMAIPASASA